MYICITCTYRFATALTFCLSVTKLFFGCRGRDLQCRQVKFTQVESRVILVQVKSSQESQKLVTGVRLESTINAAIEGIHVHRSVKLFLVLLRGLRGAPQSLSTARTPHARPSLCPRKIPAGTRGAPVPASQFTRGAPFRTRGGLELLAAGSVHNKFFWPPVGQRVNTHSVFWEFCRKPCQHATRGCDKRWMTCIHAGVSRSLREHASMPPDKRHCRQWMSSLFCGFLPNPFIHDLFCSRHKFVKMDL